MVAGLLALTAVVAAALSPVPVPGSEPPPAVAKGGGRVIVEFEAPGLGRSGAVDRADLSRRVRTASAEVVSSLPASVRIERQFDAVPAFVATVDEDGLAALQAHPRIRSVVPDRQLSVALTGGARLIRADEARTALGVTGAGMTAAVIDTGIDTDHPDIVGDVAFEVCFMAAGCPLGGTFSSGPGAAEDDNGHGTRVSGVITSSGNVAPLGIAPDTAIGAYKTLGAGGSGSLADVLAALNDVIANHPEVRVVNMSLSDATNHGASCDALSPSFTTAVNTLVASNTLVFAAAGNEGFTNGLAFPACITNVTSVSGVWDDTRTTPVNTVPCSETPRFDRVVCFGNSATTLDLLGPGGIITTSGLGGGTANSFGTSIATPHAAAAAALLWSFNGSLTATQVESALKTTGVARTDPKSGVTTPRLDVWKAVASLIGDPDGDGILGPLDNCPLHNNPSQLNSDRNFVDMTPPLAQDDATWPNSDNMGDACDDDDDNDGLSDALEAVGCNGSGPLDPVNRDTDGDRFLDGAECVLGSNPSDSASRPLVSDCGPLGDTDGDKLPDRVEFCFYNTDPFSAETDGDASTTGGHDGCEAASFNGDRVVNVADMGMLAAAITNIPQRHVNLDVNKDGVWNPADQGLVASLVAPSGQCP
jgi:subtilisin family serine protease